MRIIVADDDLGSRILLQGAVEHLGHECLVAEDGMEAWELLEGSAADVLITDRMMPGMDGIELCRRVRLRTDTNYTYVILVTSLGDRDEILAGMHGGADDYLTKPLDPTDLEASLIAARRVTSLHEELGRYRADLARLACTDPLTQLRNRLSLDDDLRALHARSQRFGRTYCVAMCDVDHFKSYNDTFGHQAGDEVLRKVAAAMAAQARTDDCLYRYGGEEFLLLMAEQTPATAFVAADRMREAVEQLGLAHTAESAAGVVTISVGVAGCDLSDGLGEDTVLSRADSALYEAKAAGRNRVALFDELQVVKDG